MLCPLPILKAAWRDSASYTETMQAIKDSVCAGVVGFKSILWSINEKCKFSNGCACDSTDDNEE